MYAFVKKKKELQAGRHPNYNNSLFHDQADGFLVKNKSIQP